MVSCVPVQMMTSQLSSLLYNQMKVFVFICLSFIKVYMSLCLCLPNRWDELHEQGPWLRPYLQRGSRQRRGVVRVPPRLWAGQKPERLYMYVSHLTPVLTHFPRLTHTCPSKWLCFRWTFSAWFMFQAYITLNVDVFTILHVVKCIFAEHFLSSVNR